MIYLMEIRVNGMGERFRSNFFFYFFLKISYTIHKISLLVKIFFLTFFAECSIIFIFTVPKPASRKGQLSAVLPAGKKNSG